MLSKTSYFAHRQIIYITYNISSDTFQAKHRPLTPTTNDRSFIHSSICICYSYQPHISPSTKIIYEDEIDAEIQKLFKSYNKWYISL